jgi:AcrR family transcriptional regulator
VETALTDVLHRALFGLDPHVNAHAPTGDAASPLRFSTTLRSTFEQATALEREATQPGRRALASMLEVGHDVIVRCGYQGTRVDDVVEAAGVSHGAFYRYFENKDHFVRVVASQALTALSTALGEVPASPDRATLRRWLRRYNAVHSAKGARVRVWVEGGLDDPLRTDRAALRRWLRRYNTTHSAKGAMVRVWVESGLDDPLRVDRAAVFDWGRARMAQLLHGRDFGDVDADAIALLAFVEAFGAVERRPAELDAALHVLERGFL